MIRAVTPEDVDGLKQVIQASGLFPPDMLDGMIAPFLAGDATEEVWLMDDEAGMGAVAYCAPERMTVGTFNLYLIAVHPERQGQGRGTALMRRVEDMVAARGGHLLLVETSGLPEFARTRAFYAKRGYREEARIRDFYRPGEDKVVFSKALAGAARSDPL